MYQANQNQTNQIYKPQTNSSQTNNSQDNRNQFDTILEDNKNQFETLLEFHKIKEKWKLLALTKQAKKEIEDIIPCLIEAELRKMLRDTTEAKILLEKCGNPPLSAMEGIRELLIIAQKGGCLTALQLEQIKMTIVSIRRMKSYLDRGNAYSLSLPYYSENLNTPEDLEQEIHLQIRDGRVDDNATSLLKDLRSAIVRTEDKMREKADLIIRNNKQYMSDSFSTIRSGHICVPVKKEYKLKVSGSVMDKSSSGSTLFIEPSAVGKYFSELQELRLDAENEERRILYTLSAMIADASDNLEKDIKLLEKLDFIFSKGKLSIDCDACAPKINTERRITIKNGRHPLMEKEVCVPLQFRIGDGYHGVIITGPNTGGKTVAMKTVALNCIMAQCGLHITAEAADICMNSNFLCDIGDGQNISENLSTFSAHISNVLDILRKVNPDSLVIMDELGSGTDPTEGMGIAVAVLEELSKSGALFLVTTHYPEVKQYAQQREGIVNARMTFDKESLKPLYQLVIGEAGESCAFHIAKRLGMPDAMLQTAIKAAYKTSEIKQRNAENQGTEEKQEKRRNAENQETEEKQEKRRNAENQETEEKQEKRRNAENQETAENQEAIQMKKAMNNNITIKNQLYESQTIKKEPAPRIQKQKQHKRKIIPYQIGDSVMVYPEKKLGIVCETANEKGVLRVQLPNKKIWINHKRIKLQVAAQELYPEEYDFSILFESVENRKLRHQMEKHHVEGREIQLE